MHDEDAGLPVVDLDLHPVGVPGDDLGVALLGPERSWPIAMRGWCVVVDLGRFAKRIRGELTGSDLGDCDGHAF